MRLLRVAYLVAGLVLLAFVVHDTDVAALRHDLSQIGWLGIGVVLGVYLVSFVSDSAGWQLTFPSPPLSLAWLWRMVLVRMVGEAFNYVTPAAGMGGEPVKALLLKKHYGLGYRESGAAILLSRTTNLLALIPFLGAGFFLVVGDGRISPAYKALAGSGLAALAFGIIGFYLVQRFRVSSLAGLHLSRMRFAAPFAHRIEEALHHIRDFDERLVQFYTRHRARFSGALVLGLVNWLLGVVEIYYAMYFLGHPVSMSDAWVIEAVNQLVRAGTFFIPASIGAQEGAFVIVCTALTGSPVAGLGLAVVRRFRELVWIVAGLALGWLYSLRHPRFPAMEFVEKQRVAGGGNARGGEE